MFEPPLYLAATALKEGLVQCNTLNCSRGMLNYVTHFKRVGNMYLCMVLNYVSNINSSSSAKHFDTFDFATLYTNIPHDSLKINLIEEAYKVRGAKYFSISRHGTAYWSVGSTSNIDIELCELIELLEYLIDNIFIMVGNKVFKHVGIPMGTNCAPLLANLL